MDSQRQSPTERSDAPKRRDPEATRRAILDAAESLFLTHGVAETPTSRIARRAGVTKSLIHHHFGSKQALWAEVKTRRLGAYHDAQRHMLDRGPGDIALLRDSIVAFFRFLESDAQAVRMMSWFFLENDETSLDEEAELYALGLERIREAQASGALRKDVEPLVFLKSFLGLCLHWFQSRNVLSAMLGPDADTGPALDQQYLDGILKIFFDGARARPAGSEVSPDA